MATLFETIVEDLDIQRYSDWQTFLARLKGLTSEGKAKRITPFGIVDPRAEEWYLDINTGEIYSYVAPDGPLLPSWEKVDPLSEDVRPRENFVHDLSVIPTGEITKAEARGLKEILNLMIRSGKVELEEPPDRPSAAGIAESWYRDIQSQRLYRLIESNDATSCRWERVTSGCVPRNIQ